MVSIYRFSRNIVRMDFAQVIIQRSKDVVKISPSSLSTKPSAKLYVLDSIGDQRYTSIWRWWGNRIQVSLFQAVASSLDLLLDALTAWFTGLDGYWNINWSILDILTGHNEGRKKGERVCNIYSSFLVFVITQPKIHGFRLMFFSWHFTCQTKFSSMRDFFWARDRSKKIFFSTDTKSRLKRIAIAFFFFATASFSSVH